MPKDYFEYQDQWGMASSESTNQLIKLQINGKSQPTD